MDMCMCFNHMVFGVAPVKGAVIFEEIQDSE